MIVYHQTQTYKLKQAFIKWKSAMFLKLIQLDLMEEKSIEVSETTNLFYTYSNKKEQVTKRQNLTSLPDLLEIKLAQNNDQNSSRSNQGFNIQPHSMINIKNQTLSQLSQEKMNFKVYAFLLQVATDRVQCEALIQEFKKFEQDVKITVKKSKRIIQDSDKLLKLRSLNDLPQKEKKKERQCQGRKKGRFADLIQDDYQGISINLVHSNIKLSKKDTNSIRDLALSIGRLFSFGQMSGGEQKTQSIGSQPKDMIIEDQQYKSNDQKGSSRGVSLDKIECLYKNPSIIMFDDEQEEKQGEESELFSSKGEVVSIQSIPKPSISLNFDIIKRIFWKCSPFLINLSLCLMIKLLAKARMELKIDNVCWLLTTATVVAYKIFYDEEIQGLTRYFAKQLEMKNEDLVSLQIWFLNQLNYEIYVTNRQYFENLSRILTIKV